MEAALSAFLGEIASRSMSFFIGKLSKDKQAEAPYSLPSDEDLRRKLLRLRIVVEEAHGRQIRSQAMLEQLKILQAAMYTGHYALDASKYDQQAHHHQGKDDTVSHCSFAISMFNPAKRIQLCTSSASSSSKVGVGEKELRQVLGSLEIIITDAAEFIVFLKDCPPLHLHRRLYSTYLDLENCMFDRHVELEHVVNFVLAQRCSPSGCSTEDHHPDVLPIVGPAQSGKSTLIEHVCNDERVRRVFSRIVFFAENDLVTTSVRGGGGGRVKYQSHASERGESVLIIVEVNGDISEAAWSGLITLCSASGRSCATTNGVTTKIVICSRSDKIVRFGTTRALKVGYLTQEPYWHFFKALAFGSMDPEEHPKLASLAMEIATCLNGSFIAANAIARMLRDNPSAGFWRMALSCYKEVSQRYQFVLAAPPVSPSEDRKLLPRLNGSKEYCSIFNGYQIVSAQDKAPTITVQEVLSGSVVLRGKFDVLAWRSSIPPYYSYIFSCEIHEVS